MKKVKTFFHVFFNSLLPGASYYHKLRRTRFRFSFLYFAALVFFVNSVFFVALALKASPSLLDFRNELSKQVQNFPSDLTISIRNGTLHTNHDRPYMVRVGPEEKLLLVVDESAMPEKINQYKTLALLTSRELVVRTNAVDNEVYPLQNMNFTVNKTILVEFFNKAGNFIPWLVLLASVMALFIAPAFVMLSYFLSLLVASCIAYLLFKLFSKKHTFGKTFQISLHAITVPILVDYSLFLFHSKFIRPASISFLLILIFVFTALYEAYLDQKT